MEAQEAWTEPNHEAKGPVNHSPGVAALGGQPRCKLGQGWEWGPRSARELGQEEGVSSS